MKTDHSEFEQLVERCDALIARICYMYASDSDHFADLRQETLIHLWKGFGKFRGESSESTWVYRTCLNTCISNYRSNRRHKEGAVSIDEVFDLADDESSRQRMEQLQLLYRLIDTLDPLDKALVMLWLDERTYDEIAEITGIGRNTIASRLHRIRHKLAKRADEL